MIRWLKKDVLDQLPDKLRQQIAVQTDPKLLKKVKDAIGGIAP